MQTASDFLKLSVYGLQGEASGPFAIISLTVIVVAVVALRSFGRR